MKKASTFAAAFLSIAFSASTDAQAPAHPTRALTPPEEELALSVARVCANEAFHSYGDCLLIWQATRRHGDTAEARLGWLRRHSSCVLGPTDPAQSRTRIGNCRWSRHLQPGDAAPLHWPEGWVWVGINQRSWTRAYALARGLVEGRRPRGGWPCPIDPDTWAGRRTDEQRIANLPPTIVPLGCTDPHNRERPTGNEGFRVMNDEERARWDAQFVDINEGADVDRE